MIRREFLETTAKSSIGFLGMHNLELFETEKPITTIQQITKGPKNHLFGYIGQSLTIPWNITGKRLLTLCSTFIDHLPDGNEPADVSLINLDMKIGNFYKMEKVDESLGWNPQQGTMFYWNPDNPESQFFFNDRDPKTGKIFKG